MQRTVDDFWHDAEATPGRRAQSASELLSSQTGEITIKSLVVPDSEASLTASH